MSVTREILRQYAVAREFRGRIACKELDPPNSPYDGVMYSPTGVADELVIVKDRPSPKDKYPTLKIFKEKVDSIVAFAKKRNIRAVLVVRWSDETNWLNLTEIEADRDSLFPEDTIKLGSGSEGRVVYQIDTVLFRDIAIQPYQVTT